MLYYYMLSPRKKCKKDELEDETEDHLIIRDDCVGK